MSNETRGYVSKLRQEAAEKTKENILAAAKKLFREKGFDKTTIPAIAKSAGVSVPSVYALYKSKQGLLQELLGSISFGDEFKKRLEKLLGAKKSADTLKTVAEIACVVYSAEATEMEFLRGASVVSPALEKLNARIENQRFRGQKFVIERLFEENAVKPEIDFETARDILWSLTSRDLYRLFVFERKWSPEKYENWLATILISSLIKSPN